MEHFPEPNPTPIHAARGKDCFISYSRRDKTFLEKLFAALAAANFEAWVDWEDIPRGEHFLREIYQGIEAAHTFVFVLTPDSLRSEICNLEIAHARKRGKRILPILHQEVLEGGKLQGNILQAWYGETWEVVAHENWGTLKDLNWLFFRESDDFQEALAHLIHDLKADLDHVKFHTRLTVRAVEWDHGGRKRDFVLRGDDLQRAVGWLELSNQKTPPPTPLHHAYITASQIEENLDLQTRRYLLQARFGLVLAIITTLFLGCVAFAVQRQTLENSTSDLKNQLSTHQAQVATLEAITTLSPAQCPTSAIIIACPTP